ncbi:MAG TPA: hypothetical protein PKE69_20770 [Pyrinomonadaceae bacterium]|nr:hypothetical protein [Pyrinomonadaceae bacterium]
MASRITRENERNIRSDVFLQINLADFAANAFVTAQSALLHTKIVETGDARELQIASGGAARQQYELAEAANDALKQAMRDVADFALTMADEIEGIEEKFRITRGSGRRARIARARAFAADAAPHKALFIERGLENDFIEDLENKANPLEQAPAAPVKKTAERVGSTEARMLAHRESNKTITHLDPIIRKFYRNNPAKLAEWDFASHVQRDEKPKSPNNSTP